VVRSNLSELNVQRGLRKVPPFPPIAARLLTLLSNDSVAINDLADLIGSDPTFSARLLNCVNSAAFGLKSAVTNIQQALALLGLDRTRQITLTVATAAYTQGALRSNELRRCWEHTVATAMLADQIAHVCGGYTDIAYTAGIMHDIGRLGLLVAYPQEYEGIIRDAAEQCLDLLDFERDQFGMDHAEAGRILAERWNLPEEFRLVAGRHHDPCEGAEVDLLKIVHIACRLADALGYDITRPLVTLDVDAVLLDLPAGARDRLQTPDELHARIEQRIRAYDGAGDSPDNTAEPAVAVAVASEESAEELPFVLDVRRQATPESSSLIVWIAFVVLAALVVLSAVLLWK
jgi:putative nucleotidyltransferase with HDIG domain